MEGAWGGDLFQVCSALDFIWGPADTALISQTTLAFNITLCGFFFFFFAFLWCKCGSSYIFIAYSVQCITVLYQYVCWFSVRILFFNRWSILSAERFLQKMRLLIASTVPSMKSGPILGSQLCFPLWGHNRNTVVCRLRVLFAVKKFLFVLCRFCLLLKDSICLSCAESMQVQVSVYN